MDVSLLIDRLNAWVNQAFYMSNKTLATYRILYCIAVIFIIGIPNYSWIANHPTYIYNPPSYSIAAFFQGFPGFIFLETLSLSIIVLYLFLLFGFYTRLVSILLTIFMIIGQSFAFSFGKIDHNILFVILPLMMAFSAWGNHYSIDHIRGKEYSSNPWIITIIALVIGFAMFTAGVPKLLHGWLDVSSQATQSYVIKKYYSGAELALWAPYLMNLSSEVFWESLDYLAVVFEIGFLVVVFKPTIFRVFIFLALCFHFFNGLMLDVFFIGNNVVYLLFLKRGTFHSAQSFIEGRLLWMITLKNLILSIIIGVGVHFYIQYNFALSELVMTPSILKLTISFFTEKEALVTAILISIIALTIGICGFLSIVKEKIKAT